ncbi:glycosyltransferase family 2 protein [Egibacter rhizosphaerae]|uniref:glycosyltransferase family 2 protein n=1 Tax=Egibacter rhizosphaerae TaxID=1670831 RepID=UPI0013F166BD|nr:glycosyltransferase family 2 protein [Egibacter rhizosphaerae]
MSGSTAAAGAESPVRGRPPAAAVKDNDWRALPVPTPDQGEGEGAGPGEGQDATTVSVVIPARGDGGALALTLAALEAQRYPAELLEVLLVDDGSDPPLEVPREELPVRLLRQEREGFGAGRARNLGARHARGEVLLFLDADMVAEPDLVAAHVRWHRAARDAVVIGPRWFAPLREQAGDALSADALAQGRITELAADVPTEGEPWWVEFVERTDELTVARGDLHAAVISCNLSLRADYFHALGGFTAFGRRGIEDTELGWRAYADGALLVPDRSAGAWHVDAGSHLMSGEAADTKRRRLPLLWHHVPAGSARPRDAARRFLVPRVVVEVDGRGHPFEEVVDCVDGILAGRLRDVAVVVDLADDEEGRLVREALEPDDRVALDGDGPPAPVRWRLPSPVPVGPDAVAELSEPLERGQVGIVRVAVPVDTGEDAPEVVAIGWRRRAWCRAERVVADRGGDPGDEEALTEVIEELFGGRWAGGSAHGFGAQASPSGGGASPSGAGAAPSGARAASGAQLRALSQAQREEERVRDLLAKARAERDELAGRVDELAEQLTRAQNRKVVRAANRVGAVRRDVRRRAKGGGRAS